MIEFTSFNEWNVTFLEHKMDRTEIRLTTVKDFYAQNNNLFDVAVDAVVKGCVTQYHFDYKTHKFIGTVTSLAGNEMYDVEV